MTCYCSQHAYYVHLIVHSYPANQTVEFNYCGQVVMLLLHDSRQQYESFPSVINMKYSAGTLLLYCTHSISFPHSSRSEHLDFSYVHSSCSYK